MLPPTDKKKQIENEYIVSWESVEDAHGLAVNCSGKLILNTIISLTENVINQDKAAAAKLMLLLMKLLPDFTDDENNTEA